MINVKGVALCVAIEQGDGNGPPNRRQVKDCRNWPRPASRATARVAPTIHERNA